MKDRLVSRAEMRAIYGNIVDETLRRWIRDGKVPQPDTRISQKSQAWKASTLRAAGVVVPAYPPYPHKRQETEIAN